MAIRIYGASDHLIEVDGDVSDEFSAPSDCSMDLEIGAVRVWKKL